jgi:hypothetical protein
MGFGKEALRELDQNRSQGVRCSTLLRNLTHAAEFLRNIFSRQRGIPAMARIAMNTVTSAVPRCF